MDLGMDLGMGMGMSMSMRMSMGVRMVEVLGLPRDHGTEPLLEDGRGVHLQLFCHSGVRVSSVYYWNIGTFVLRQGDKKYRGWLRP